jgi:hypothetical protein
MSVMEKIDGTKVLVIDGKETTIAGVDDSSQFGFDSKNRPYFVTMDQNGKYALSVDGKIVASRCDEAPASYDITGKGIASVACVLDDKVTLTIDGKEYGPFFKDSTYYSYPASNMDNTVAVYTVSEKTGESYYLFSNGKTLGKGTGLQAYSLTFYGAGNKKIAYSVTKADGKAMVYLDGKLVPGTFDGMGYAPYASPDGKKVFFSVLKGKTYSLYLNDKEIKKGMKNMNNAYYSSKGKFFFITYETDKGYFISVNGKDYGPYDEDVGYAQYDNEETLWTSIAKKAGKYLVLVNGKEIKP